MTDKGGPADAYDAGDLFQRVLAAFSQATGGGELGRGHESRAAADAASGPGGGNGPTLSRLGGTVNQRTNGWRNTTTVLTTAAGHASERTSDATKLKPSIPPSLAGPQGRDADRQLLPMGEAQRARPPCPW